MQAVDDFGQRQGTHPRRCKFDRQRNAVESVADLGHQGEVVGSDLEFGPRLTSAVGEQLDRLAVPQRGNPPNLLTGHRDRFPAGRQYPQRWARPEQRDDQSRAPVEQVLAVVQHYQHAPVADTPHNGVHRRAARLIRQPQNPRRRDRHQRRVGDRRQVDIPNPVRITVGNGARDLCRQACLSDPADTGKGDPPFDVQQPTDLRHFVDAPHQPSELGRKTVRTNDFPGPQRRERVVQIRVTQLHHPFRSGQVVPPVGTEVVQPRVLGQQVSNQIAGSSRQHGLAPVGQLAQPGGAVDGRPYAVALVG
ncbi:Uncharacterised protein [Mycobacterium tuberculosis]|nr:Uncharacterised protein [Mycobacterium tuberculosis]CNM81254.1 Uncharacterised protein [Mycobacterium tuberculosis]